MLSILLCTRFLNHSTLRRV